MGNKLRDLFSESDIGLNNGVLEFDSSNKRDEFIEKLKQLWKTGEPQEINDLKSISTTVSEGENSYPILEKAKVNRCLIAPCKHQNSIMLKTEKGTVEYYFTYYETMDKYVLSSPEGSIIDLKVEYSKENNTIQLDYNTNIENADSIERIVDSFEKAEAFIVYLIDEEKSAASLSELMSALSESKAYFIKLLELEKLLNIHIDPKELINRDIPDNVGELYSLLVAKEIIHYAMTESDEIVLTVSGEVDSNHEGAIWFTSEREYMLFGQVVKIYTANVLMRAILKKKEEDSPGKTRLIFGGTDEQPMYLSFSGFLNAEDAEGELKRAMKSIKEYSI